MIGVGDGRGPCKRITGEGCQIVKRMVTNGKRSVRKLSRAVQVRSPISRSASRRLRKSSYYRPVVRSLSYFCLRHSHGGTGCESAHKPFFASRASFSSPSGTVSPGAYLRYHQQQPSLTRDWLTLVPSSRNTSAMVRLYLSSPKVWTVTSLPKTR